MNWGVDIDDVIVLHGDTAIVQYGIGTFGSRGTAVGGTALYFAIEELKKKIMKFGVHAARIRGRHFVDGRFDCNKTGQSVRSPRSPGPPTAR